MAIARHASPFNEQSPSPPPQPLTKRDVRRNRIVEKLQGMMNTFAMNQNHHYRAQLQGVQVDMTMVLRADPYGAEGPLNDNYDGVREMIDQVMKGDANGNGEIKLPADEAARDDYWSMAGKRYREFVRQVNDAVEERDADLTRLHDNYKSSLGELDRLYQQRLHQAEEEHKALSDTIRQRLIASLSRKRQQLLRDKEQLDIADSNAMLMHPNQFSIGNNPGSPGHNGVAINKRTRHLRHHRGLSPAPAGAEGENGKRKRKYGQTEDDLGGESPAPALAGARSPFKDARGLREYTQFEAPAYSLERIFTDKELAMATDTAKIATYKYFHQPQQQPQEQALNGNADNGLSVDGEVVESAEGIPDDAMADVPAGSSGAVNTPPPPPPPQPVEMERTASQVLTRGGARANPLAALSDLANAAAAASSTAPVIKDNPFTPVPPTYHAVTRSEKSGAPAPPPVSTLDIENDFEMMRRAGADMPDALDLDGDTPMDSSSAAALPSNNMHPDAIGGDSEASEMRRQLLDQALGVSGVQAPYRLPQLETGPGAVIGRGVDREPRTGFAPLLSVLAAPPPPPPPAAVASALDASSSSAAVGRGLRGPAAFSLGFTGGSLGAALSGRLGGGEPMSRTTSAGGASELGEAPAPAPGRRGGRGRMV